MAMRKGTHLIDYGKTRRRLALLLDGWHAFLARRVYPHFPWWLVAYLLLMCAMALSVIAGVLTFALLWTH